MKEEEAIKYAKELGTLKFSFMCDNCVHYETVRPIMIDGHYFHVGVELYIKNGCSPTLFDYDELENMNMDYYQLASIDKLDSKTIKKSLYFSKYKETFKNLK